MASLKYETSSLLEDLFFTWIFSPLSYLLKNNPDLSNSFNIPKQYSVEEPLEELKSLWSKESLKKEASLLGPMLKVIYKDILKSILAILLGVGLQTSQGVQVYLIISYLTDTSAPMWEGVILGLFFILSCIFSCCFKHNGSLRALLLTGKVKNMIVQLVSEKLISLNYCASHAQNTKGKLLNVISSDLEILELSVYSFFFFCIPFTIPAIMIILTLLFGKIALLGIAISILHTPVVFILGKLMVKIKLKASKIADKRIKMIQNLIEGIKIVKLYAWELPLLGKISLIREDEIKMLKKSVFYGALLNVLSAAGNNLMIFAALSIHVYLGNDLSPGKVFMLVSLYHQAHWGITYISNTGVNIVFAFNGILKRTSQLLLLPEKYKFSNISHNSSFISLKNVSFSWKLKEEKNDSEDLNSSKIGLIRSKTVQRDAIRDVSIQVNPGQLLMVVGPVGCGKTSLLMGLLDEITLTSGEYLSSRSQSFAGEDPWLVSGSIKENILMGQEMIPERYAMVLSVCDLDQDLALFSHQDETLVGDKGLTLSGGQRARVSLARAVYAQADVYILDDPLSAVDSKVANRLFERCIRGWLKDKIVILATHQIQFLSQTHLAIVLDHGEQVFFGTYEQIKENQEVKEILGNFKFPEREQENTLQEKVIDRENTVKLEKMQENTTQDTAGFKTFWKYSFQAFGSIWMVLVVLMFMAIAHACQLFTIYWPSYWSKQQDQGNSKYLEIYGILLILTYFTSFLKTFPFMLKFISGNIGLHNQALKGLCFAPSNFFDKNQTGWLLNRFSKDVSMVDGPLQHYIFESINNTLTVAGYILIIIIVMPYTVIVVPIMSLTWYFLFKKIGPLIVQLRKLELVSRGPLLSAITSVYEGLPTVRCLSLERFFLDQCKKLSNLHQRSYITFHIILRFVQLYFEFVSIVIQAINVILIISLKETTDPGLAAFSLSTSISILNLTSLWFKAILEISTSLSSTQRLHEFSDLMPEGIMEEPSEFRITEGKIEFQEVSMRYRPELDRVLNNLTFEIPPKSKVGIVGRTGSGKSSILQVLFRLTSPECGTIKIDGVDYLKAGLHQLRRQMSVIPQSAVLFSGTVRHNLDPFEYHSDLEILEALDKVKLKRYILEQDFALNTEISSNGISFSAGQRQMLCVARAILRGNKIVMMDEATANVDNETDKFIQSSIKSLFDDCTVIVIAHRLRTIIGSDVVLVVDKGTCVEIGSPKDLGNKQSSAFYQMIENTGKEESGFLRNLIENHRTKE
jgi:ATP-binding cassette subfamily C (CFTR/MRP) protein 4